jgi:hypothetical protein
VQLSFELPARFAFGNVPVRVVVPNVSVKQAVKFFAKMREIFGDTECGMCKSKDIYFATAGKGGTMCRLQCAKCPAQIDLGTAKDESSHEIWAKRWDKDAGKPLPNGGWHEYRPDGAAANGVGDANEGPATGDQPANDINGVPFAWLLPLMLAASAGLIA